MRYLLGILLLLPCAAHGQVFDLVCNGNESSGIPSDLKTMRQRKLVSTYRVDLTARRFCSGPCTETKEIASITETQIRLVWAKEGLFERYLTINRESGAFLRAEKMGDYTTVEDGACHKEPFSGFPARKF